MLVGPEDEQINLTLTKANIYLLTNKFFLNYSDTHIKLISSLGCDIFTPKWMAFTCNPTQILPPASFWVGKYKSNKRTFLGTDMTA
jgi:hypothetical protein